MNWRDYIVSDPEVLVRKPAVKGTRLSVDLILDRVADGWTAEDLLRAYPRLTPEALQAVFAFAVEALDEGYHAWEETVHLLRSPKNADRIDQALRDLQAGRGVPFNSFALPSRGRRKRSATTVSGSKKNPRSSK